MRGHSIEPQRIRAIIMKIDKFSEIGGERCERCGKKE